MIRVAAAVLAVIAASVDLSSATEVQKLDMVRFIHIPKCGSSFISPLRSVVDACVIKNGTCNGLQGGLTSDNVKFGNTFDMKELNCHGHLLVCVAPPHFHDGFRSETDGKYNMVTVLRHPLHRMISHHLWDARFGNYKARSDGLRATLEFHHNIQTAMLGEGPWDYDHERLSAPQPDSVMEPMFQHAKEVLVNNITFFGITDHWRATVCLLHRRHGGAVQASDLSNTRPANREYKPSTEDVSLILEWEKWDVQLFEFATGLFRERAEHANCWSRDDEALYKSKYPLQ